MFTNRMFQAEPYRHNALGAFGKAALMLIRQHEFPDTYDPRERFHSVDSDRCFEWDYDHARRCFKTHTGTGELGLGEWVIRSDDAAIMTFLKDVMKADTTVAWTGYRILGTVNRSNGYVVWSLQLFAKHPESRTVTYTGPNAPNVKLFDGDAGWNK